LTALVAAKAVEDVASKVKTTRTLAQHIGPPEICKVGARLVLGKVIVNEMFGEWPG
jgi:hypothetical protein